MVKYEEKRNFKETPEPVWKRGNKKGRNVFVVQKHKASHLHYDFRLEIDGVLKSWAVPKGISLNPKEKRLAVETEDHPIDYKNFEGVIPQGNYGAGVVMIWDRGTYKNIKEGEIKRHYKKGRMEFFLRGKKLKGRFALIRMRNSKNWIIIKMKDEFADKKIIDKGRSVKSGKTLEEIENS